ncbi:hypothetical protein EJ110_NYTH44475 [Nymphaea thermarum]|nr:hypothetical protein EJ110_NYTH44475 [Nymphaea thermarum]
MQLGNSVTKTRVPTFSVGDIRNNVNGETEGCKENLCFLSTRYVGLYIYSFIFWASSPFRLPVLFRGFCLLSSGIDGGRSCFYDMKIWLPVGEGMSFCISVVMVMHERRLLAFYGSIGSLVSCLVRVLPLGMEVASERLLLG